MFIQTETTPNPATLKFLPGETVMSAGTADFPAADGAGNSPLAQRLFSVPGVTGVFLGHRKTIMGRAEYTVSDLAEKTAQNRIFAGILHFGLFYGVC